MYILFLVSIGLAQKDAEDMVGRFSIVALVREKLGNI
jgi:hypothetical protein